MILINNNNNRKRFPHSTPLPLTLARGKPTVNILDIIIFLKILNNGLSLLQLLPRVPPTARPSFVHLNTKKKRALKCFFLFATRSSSDSEIRTVLLSLSKIRCVSLSRKKFPSSIPPWVQQRRRGSSTTVSIRSVSLPRALTECLFVLEPDRFSP